MRFRLGGLFIAIALLSQCVLAASSPPPIPVYGALPTLTDPTLSPSGERLAMILTLQGKRKLVAAEKGGKVLAAADLGDVKVRDVHWAGENFVVAGFSTTQNLGIEYGFVHELYNAITLDVATRSARVLLDGSQRRIVNAVFGMYGFRQANDHWSVFVGALPLGRDSRTGQKWIAGSEPELVRIDLASGKASPVAVGLRNGRGWVLDGSGAVLAHESYDDVRSKWSLYAGKQREQLLVERDDPFGWSELIGQGRGPGTLLYVVDDEVRGARYMEMALSAGSAVQEIFEDWSVARPVFHPQTKLLAGAVKTGDQRDLVMFDDELESRIRSARNAFPGKIATITSWSDDFNRFVVLTEGDRDSGTWWLVDVDSGKAVILGQAYPEVRADNVGAVRIVNYQAADGLALAGVLTLPPGSTRGSLPLVVLPHGGPQARDYPQFDWWAQAFASRGYAVWQPNFRGSSGYGKALRDAGLGQWGRKMQTDISDGVKELERQGVVDAKRACIVGGSYGGYAALAGVTVQQGLYKCAVAVAGVADLRDMLVRESVRRTRDATRYWQAFMGARGPTDKALDDYSPARLASRADAPVLLIHGKDDTVVPFKQSRTMYDALESAGKPVELVELEGEDHWLSRERTRIEMLEAAVRFVTTHNPVAP